ncbi:peptidoglycan recognition protein [Streptomyces sp. NPDC048290]|uniref:peptidoglycan recognition protein family protein n=1 Tax=Streptomyces sp. NPDC048290 TaxID=3155811 RepID=UPI003432FFC4
MSSRRTHAYKPLSLKRRVWLTIGAVVLSGTGAVTYAVADEPVPPADGNGGTREPAVHTLELSDEGAGRKGLDRRSTQRFSAVQLTWNDPGVEAEGTPEVRTRDADSGDWSAWRPLEQEPNQAEGAERTRAAVRGGTEALWTGAADGVEVRLVRPDGTEAPGQPAGMDVKLLDPGTVPAGPVLDPAAFTTDESSTVAKPPVISQAEWGASTDYDGTPSYGTEIKAAVVHHTGGDLDNTVSCADSPAYMRTLQQSHFARGYFDVGYNFVVDKCGQIFEGRSGGMDLPVVGAHDIGFNTNTLGVSYIGNFETAEPSPAALDALARVVAWKFGMYGIDPTGQVTLTSGIDKGVDGNKVAKGESITLPRVFGHRDTNSTLCPGLNLYPKLPLIAELAKAQGV